MAGYVELLVDQGTTFQNIIYVTDDTTNASVNIYGYVVTSQMRRSYYSANISANITCTVSNTSNGEIILTMPSSETANIKAGRYVFDVKTVTSGGIVNRILEGTITILPQVTR